MVELVFPLVPFQTDNSHARIAVEIPFYYAVAGVYQFLTRAAEPPGHWGMTVGVALFEAVAMICIIGLGWRIMQSRHR
jgi:hypothetical protein